MGNFFSSAYAKFGQPNPQATKWRSGGSVRRDYRDEKEQETVESVLASTKILKVPQQNIGLDAAKYFGIRSAVSEENGVDIVATYFPYRDKYGNLTGYKKRDWTLPKEQKGHWSVVGVVKANSQFFGQKMVGEGSDHRKIIICEGEGDVIAAWQTEWMMVKKIATDPSSNKKAKAWAQSVLDGIKSVQDGGSAKGFPTINVVGLNCGCANAVDAFANNEKFIRGFDEIVLAFDNDAANDVEKLKHVTKGVEATHNVAAFLMADNVYHVQYPSEVNDPEGYKDIRDLFKAKKFEQIHDMFKNPIKYVPDAVAGLSDFSIEDLRKKSTNGVDIGAEFPKLQKMLKGLHKGTLVMLTGPSGGGKTTVAKKIEHQIAKYLMDPTVAKADDYDPEDRLCMIHLEEDPEEAINSLYANQLGYDIKNFMEDPSKYLTEQEHFDIHKAWVDADKIRVFRHFGSIPVNDLITKLKQMVCLYHCRYIVLDHLSMVISGLNVKDERKELDLAMTQLAAFCKQFNVFILVIAHLRRTEIIPPKDKEGRALPFWYPVRKENLRGCVSADTEFLTPQGWKRIDEYTEGDLVAQHDENGVMTFVTPKAYINLPCEEMWHVSNTHVVDMLLSDEHRVVYVNDRTPDVFRTKTMLEVVYDHNNKPSGMRGKIPTTFITGCDGTLGLTDDQLRLQIAVNADGTVLTESTGRVAVRIKKDRKKQRLEMLLEKTNTPYRSFDLHGVHEGRTEYQFKAPCGYKGVTEEWFSLKQRELEIICDEVMYWDGDSVNRNRVSTVDKLEADFLQFAYSACGHRTSVTVKEDNSGFGDKYNYKPLYNVNVCDTKYMHIRKGSNNKPSIERVPSPDGRKYCFTLPSGMWVARRNGRIFITGNSGSMEQLSWVVVGVEAEEMPDRSRGRVRLVSLKNRPAKTLGIADVLIMDPETGKFSDASDWVWDKETGFFLNKDGDIVWRPQDMFDNEEHVVVETPEGKVTAEVKPQPKPVDAEGEEEDNGGDDQSVVQQEFPEDEDCPF